MDSIIIGLIIILIAFVVAPMVLYVWVVTATNAVLNTLANFKNKFRKTNDKEKKE
jgi:hypothetical protein